MTSMNHHLGLLHQPIKILNTNSLHFITLSLLFLPLTFSITTIIQLHHLTSADVTTILQTLTTFKNLTTLLTVIISTITGTALITYSTHQAIYRTPLTFSSTFKSLSHSFIPLLSTFLAGIIKLTLVSLLLTLSSTVLNEFRFFLFVISRVLLIVIVLHLVNWGSVPSVVVLESKYGFEALRKSASQSVMVRVYSFVFMLFTGGMIGLMLYYCAVVNNMESVVSKWISIVQVSAYHIQSCMTIALYLVMNSVLYVWFKAGNGDEKVKIVVDEGGGFTAKDMLVLVHGGFSYTLHLFVIVAFISLYVGFH
ncbi:hypothetical protein Tco_0326849 [Tanacetum coccineum]